MAKINIGQEGFRTNIDVDGVRLQGVLEANVWLVGGQLPTVEVRLYVGAGGMDFSDGRLKVGAMDAPEALERALLAHLKAKYESSLDKLLALPVRSIGIDPGGPESDLTAVAVCEDGKITSFATVPAGEDCMEAVRALSKRHGGGSGG